MIRLIILLGFFLYLGIKPAYSVETYDKAWAGIVFTDSLFANSSFKYYLEDQNRLIITDHVFNQLLLLGGIGYQFNKRMSLFTGPGLIVTKSVFGGELFYEERYWQQFNWHLLKTSHVNIHSRSRLEERKITQFAPISFRFRERIWLRIPFTSWKGYSFSSFDEIFLNLNHPKWTSPYLVEQNRVFIGISYQLSKSTIIDVGYLNQYLRSFITQKDNVALLSFTVNK